MSEHELVPGISYLLYHKEHKLWLGFVPTKFGPVEVVVDGTPESPDEQELAALRGFLANSTENILNRRKYLRLGFLYKPARLALLHKKEVGVQFYQMFTRKLKMVLENGEVGP